MNIYFSHSSHIDYVNTLYLPIKNYFKNTDFLFFLPEEHKINTKEVIKNTDLFFCDVTNARMGAGIEMGRAESFNKPIYCFYKKGSNLSDSIKYVTDNIYCYNTTDELLKIMKDILTNLSKDDKN